MLGITLAVGAVAVVAVYWASRVAMGVGADLRAAVFTRVQAFSAREVNRFGTASLITRNTTDIQQVQLFLQMALTLMVIAPIMSVGGVIMALKEGISPSALLAVAVPVIAVVIGAMVILVVPQFRTMQVKIDRINQVLRHRRRRARQRRRRAGPGAGTAVGRDRAGPAGRKQAGLRDAILALTGEAAPALGFTPAVSFEGHLDSVPEQVAAHVLAVCREALSNIARHAAASAAAVTLTAESEVLLRITDNGRGLGEVTRSSGLRNMRERAEMLGGTFLVASEPGAGTRLEWRVPLGPGFQ
jgi:ABC transporter transmembrane region